MELWHYLLLALAGLAAGFVDAIAGGGGLITIPALLWAGLPTQSAIGTNKMQSCCGTALAVRNYARAGLIRWREVRAGILFTLLFAALGAWMLSYIKPDLLKRIVPWMLIGIAAYTVLSPRMGEVERHARLQPFPFALLGGAVLGFYDGIFGPGTGSFWALACVVLAAMELRRATAFTKVMNLTSNLASLAVFLMAGLVRFDVAAVMIAGQLAGAHLGSHTVIKNGPAIIRPVLFVTVLALAGKLIWDQMHSPGRWAPEFVRAFALPPRGGSAVRPPPRCSECIHPTREHPTPAYRAARRAPVTSSPDRESSAQYTSGPPPNGAER